MWRGVWESALDDVFYENNDKGVDIHESCDESNNEKSQK